jgi:hypothetical protein
VGANPCGHEAEERDDTNQAPHINEGDWVYEGDPCSGGQGHKCAREGCRRDPPKWRCQTSSDNWWSATGEVWTIGGRLLGFTGGVEPRNGGLVPDKRAGLRVVRTSSEGAPTILTLALSPGVGLVLEEGQACKPTP